jgi:ABC-2 type transport system ATP-binding protein
MFKVKDIEKTFKQDFWSKSFHALDGVSFEIYPGDIVGFLGANGAGKTTLLKILMGFIPSDSGAVEFHEKMGNSQKEIFSKIGFLPERPYFYPYLKGRDFIKYVASISRVEENLINDRLEELSKEFKIDHALDREIRGYSKGMLQRLGFVATLIHDPELIILDEPLSGLDPLGRKEIKDHLVRLNSAGKTVFFSSHIVSDIEEVCTKTIVLNKGKLAYQGEIEKLLANSRKDTYQIIISKNTQRDLIESYEYSFLGERIKLDVSVSNKDKVLRELVEKGIVVDEVKRDTVSLEEVVYDI